MPYVKQVFFQEVRARDNCTHDTGLLSTWQMQNSWDLFRTDGLTGDAGGLASF